nr:hypothetical protein MFLOJ_24120 [Mycobacterium florentinum]
MQQVWVDTFEMGAATLTAVIDTAVVSWGDACLLARALFFARHPERVSIMPKVLTGWTSSNISSHSAHIAGAAVWLTRI